MDIRQSDEWSEYLRMYGWVSERLSSNDIFRFVKRGPLCFGKLHRPANLKIESIAELENVAKKHAVTSFKISQSYEELKDDLRSSGYKESHSIDLPPRTMLIDLCMDLNEIRAKFTHTCRWSINKSQKDGDRVEIIQNPKRKDVDEYYKIVSSRASKKGFYVQSLQDQIKKTEVFGNKAFIFNVYSSEHKILGTKMFLGFNKTIWYMHGGITNLGVKSSGGYLAIWEALKYFKSLRYELFDFESMVDKRLSRFTRSWRGYSDFKMKFGGKIVEFPLPVIKYFRYLSILNQL